jgi:DMSO/TMAO reductase YedYZ heme-binding membrane subunit
MINIIFITLLTLIAVYLNKILRKQFVLITVIVTALSAYGLLYEVDLLINGFLGLAMFVVVMYAGALNPKSNFAKKLLAIRKEYSIWGFILVSAHFIHNIPFENIFDIDLLGTASFLIMVPLFITSFQNFRKKMPFKSWKKLHRFSYLAYATMFGHLILVTEEVPHRVIYAVLVIVYLILKRKKEFS